MGFSGRGDQPCKAPGGFCSFIPVRLLQVTLLMTQEPVAVPDFEASLLEVSLHRGQPHVPCSFI